MRMRNRGFTLIELLVVILILGILMAMTVPRIAGVRQQAREAAMKMNLHNVQVVIEQFHAEKGYYAEDFYEDGYGSVFPGGIFDQQIGTLPTNPWTGRQMDPDEFNPEDYDKEADLSDANEGGPNDQYDYGYGEIIYGIWTPLGADNPTGYGLVGIGRGGMSIRSFNQDDEAIIFLLHS
ncbi:type II secretion system protein [candidate division WOR-3 bacterium]|uniref:Type II secretion system protein n=1 Tax=candidate division WOR-3 bacterium TaxID=2052148 RepID=A0A937XHQ6_UNCW3|nr:type II secretion system protein [candidate division WOR-3 bacterium]